MARYFFDIDDSVCTVRDDQGIECRNLDSARREALRALPDLAREAVSNGLGRAFRVTVRDASGRSVFQSTLSIACEWLD